MIRNIQLRHAGKYTCAVQTKVDSVSIATDVVVRGKQVPYNKCFEKKNNSNICGSAFLGHGIERACTHITAAAIAELTPVKM